MLYPPRRGTTILVARQRAAAMKSTDSTRAEAAAFWKMKESFRSACIKIACFDGL